MSNVKSLIPKLGSCCICKSVSTVRNVVFINKKSPIPSRGWGCVICHLPPNGALAVLCDSCLQKFQNGKSLKFACRGYPETDGRIPFEDLKGHFDHAFEHP